MMSISNPKLKNEKSTVEQMIKMYCRKHHLENNTRFPCDECENLLDYAFLKLDKCVYGEKKPPCNKCSTHCYNQRMRNKIRPVMMYSGPRMFYKHPVLAIRYMINKMNFK